jgi:tetratricopeptide (TPR) repeat protein
LLYGGSFSWSSIRGDTRFVPLLEEALAAVTASGKYPAMRVMLMSRLAAGPLRDLADRRPRLEMIQEAVALAREVGDPQTLAYALEARLSAIIGPVPEDLAEILSVSEEIERIATALNDGEKALMSHLWRLLAHLYFGNMPRVQAERQAMARIAEQLRQGPHNWFRTATDAQLAFLAGRFADAERLALQAYEIGGRVDPYALFAFRVQMLWMRMEQARESEMEAEFRDSMHRFSGYPFWPPIASYLLIGYGTEEEARALFRATLPTPHPANEEYLLAMAALAEAAASLREKDAADVLYAELHPYSHLTMGGVPDINLGSTSRVLGRLAYVLGRVDDAERHFQEAIGANDDMGARPWAARARCSYAELLLERNKPGDRENAATLLAQARVTAEDIGMVRLAREIDAMERPAKEETSPAPVASEVQAFRREGEYWTVVYESDAFRLRDSKGLSYLADLLAAPGREFHVLDLVGAAGSRNAPGRDDDLSAGDVGDAGEILDPEAKAAYRSRLAELDETIEEARSWGDDERAARAIEERDALLGQLAGAVGLGGRDRKAASASERARVNVTRAIKSAVARIAEQSPALGKHLDATLRTGTFCSYTPDPRSRSAWKT